MKLDAPPRRAQFLGLAAKDGFSVYNCVSNQNLTVVSIDKHDALIRFFAPDVRIAPWGTQIDGAVGMALLDETGGYRSFAVFQNIANFRNILKMDRRLEHPHEMSLLLRHLRKILTELPNSPCAVLTDIENAETWLAKQLAWERDLAVSFVNRARELCDERL